MGIYPKAIDRLTSYLYHAKPRSMEMIIDEMLAIRAEIDAYHKAAMSDDYDNLLCVSVDYVERCNARKEGR